MSDKKKSKDKDTKKKDEAQTSSASELFDMLKARDNSDIHDLQLQLEKARSDIEAIVQKKKKADRSVHSLKNQLLFYETAYLADTLYATTALPTVPAYGNIIRGYDGYLKAAIAGVDRKRTRAQDDIKASDRVFSQANSSKLAEELATLNSRPEADLPKKRKR